MTEMRVSSLEEEKEKARCGFTTYYFHRLSGMLLAQAGKTWRTLPFPYLNEEDAELFSFTDHTAFYRRCRVHETTTMTVMLAMKIFGTKVISSHANNFELFMIASDCNGGILHMHSRLKMRILEISLASSQTLAVSMKVFDFVNKRVFTRAMHSKLDHIKLYQLLDWMIALNLALLEVDGFVISKATCNSSSSVICLASCRHIFLPKTTPHCVV